MPLPEYSYNPSWGNFGVHVIRTQSHFTTCASIGVQYDAYLDSEHTIHPVFMPWDGGRVSVAVADVEKLLNPASVPEYIGDVSAVNMILRCVEEILNDQHQQPAFSSVLAKISTVQETGLFSEDEDEDEENDGEQG